MHHIEKFWAFPTFQLFSPKTNSRSPELQWIRIMQAERFIIPDAILFSARSYFVFRSLESNTIRIPFEPSSEEENCGAYRQLKAWGCQETQQY